ncbi:hypothetical protein [Pararhizobium sp.]|uniref:hypothetical protein n=1 Tax=Pararhizobium sp. TaxID=1977563 RepID=UPI003D132B2C
MTAPVLALFDVAKRPHCSRLPKRCAENRAFAENSEDHVVYAYKIARWTVVSSNMLRVVFLESDVVNWRLFFRA